MFRPLHAVLASMDRLTDGGESASIRTPPTRTVILAMVAATAVVVAVGLLTGNPVFLLGLLVFLPAFAAALCTPHQTALVSAWVSAVVLVPVVLQPGGELIDDAVLALLVVAFDAMAVYGSRVRITREEELVRLRSSAAAMQRQILQPLPVLTDDVLVDGVYEPVQQDELVGGDIYEVAATPWGTRVLIGDVQGKGLAAIGAAVAVVGAFREAAHREPTLTALVDALEAAVVRHNDFSGQRGEPERFVTALVVGVDKGTEAQIVVCGHTPPYVLHDEAVTTVATQQEHVPLGLGALVDEPRTVTWFAFPAGSTLLLCTDGLTEARAPGGGFYPLEARLGGRTDITASRLTRSLVAELRDFTAGTQQDDVAVLAVRRSPHQPPELQSDGALPADALR